MTLVTLAAVLAAAVLLFLLVRPVPEREYDVIVVGAGTGGTAAALQAARMGARVVLLEETDWVGGQATAAGVSMMDGGHPSGIYQEFIDRATAHYRALGKSVGTCFGADQGLCFEPHVAQSVLLRMMEEARAGGAVLDFLPRTRVNGVLREGTTVLGVRMDGGRTLRGEVVIDATEYGDVIPLAGAAYRVGNQVGGSVDPGACVQDITYTAVIRKYPRGVPPELRVPAPPPGYGEEVRRRFATVVARGGSSHTWGPYPKGFAAHNAYRGMPDSLLPGSYTGLEPERVTKTGVNWANDYPAELPYISTELTTLSVRYLEDPAFRARANCEAKLKTLQFLYYVQHDLGEAQWSVALEEGYDTPYNREENLCPNIPAPFKAVERNLPLIPYVRESRRLVGLHTLTAGEIEREGDPPRGRVAFPTSIAVGDYPNDLHNCNREEDLESSLESLRDVPPVWTPGFFQIPMESLIPKTVDGLLAAEKNLSQSRLASGATRLQPVTMMTGQAAGALAALAARRNVPPRRVDALPVQRALLDAGAVISQLTFSDVPKGHSHWKAVQLLSARGLLGNSGGTLEPEKLLTPAQTAELELLLGRLAGRAPETVVPSATVSRGQAASRLAQALQGGGEGYNSPTF